MRRRRTVVTVAAIAVLMAAGGAGSRAWATCAAPFVGVVTTQPIAVGSDVILKGEALGDQCYDTGIPDGALGVLGTPLSDIDVFIIQDGTSIRVAHGHANRDYEFIVEVTVPRSLTAGPAEVAFRVGDGPVSTTMGLELVAPGAPLGPADVTVVTFGTKISAPNRLGEVLRDAAPWVGLAVLIVGVAIVLRHRRQPTGSPSPSSLV